MESLFETDPRALKTASDVLIGGIGEHYVHSIYKIVRKLVMLLEI